MSDSLKEALMRQMTHIKAKLHSMGGDAKGIDKMGGPEHDMDKLNSDRAPDLKDDAAMGGDPAELSAMDVKEDDHAATPMGGALSPEEHEKVISAIAGLHSPHMGRKPMSLGEHASHAAKGTMAKMKGKKV